MNTVLLILILAGVGIVVLLQINTMSAITDAVDALETGISTITTDLTAIAAALGAVTPGDAAALAKVQADMAALVERANALVPTPPTT